jgi:hypothetical protein
MIMMTIRSLLASRYDGPVGQGGHLLLLLFESFYNNCHSGRISRNMIVITKYFFPLKGLECIFHRLSRNIINRAHKMRGNACCSPDNCHRFVDLTFVFSSRYVWSLIWRIGFKQEAMLWNHCEERLTCVIHGKALFRREREEYSHMWQPQEGSDHIGGTSKCMENHMDRHRDTILRRKFSENIKEFPVGRNAVNHERSLKSLGELQLFTETHFLNCHGHFFTPSTLAKPDFSNLHHTYIRDAEYYTIREWTKILEFTTDEHLHGDFPLKSIQASSGTKERRHWHTKDAPQRTAGALSSE